MKEKLTKYLKFDRQAANWQRPLPKVDEPESITGLEWLPDTTITDAEWTQAKDIAAFLVDSDTLLDRALKGELKYTAEVIQSEKLLAAMFGPAYKLATSGEKVTGLIATLPFDAAIKGFTALFSLKTEQMKIPFA